MKKIAKKHHKKKLKLYYLYFSLAFFLSIVVISLFLKYNYPKILGVNTTTNPIQLENQNPGSTGWRITQPSNNGEIQGYAGADSVNKGGLVALYISTKVVPDRFTIDVYRLGYYKGLGGRLVLHAPGGSATPQGYYPTTSTSSNPISCPTCITSYKVATAGGSLAETYLTDANWKVTTYLSFPTTWVSGIYEVKLTDQNGYQWTIPIVMRDDLRKSDLIFEDPVNTDQAYNLWGGTSLYKNFRNTSLYQAYYVSFNRPYLSENGAGNLFIWTYAMLRFLEQNGYDVSYTTNTAVSNAATNLSNYKGFVISGHDEYISSSEKQKVTTAVQNGMSLANFAANSFYWQVRNSLSNETPMGLSSNRLLVGYKDLNQPYADPVSTVGNPNIGLTTTQWRMSPLNSPEDLLFKIMYISYGPYGNMAVKNTNNWIFTNSGLVDGDTLKGVLGYEVDSLFADGSLLPRDQVIVVAQTPFLNAYNKIVTQSAILDEIQPDSTNSYVGGNIIFSTGSVFWPYALSDIRTLSGVPESSAVQMVTNNILSRMITGSIPVVSPTPTGGICTGTTPVIEANCEGTNSRVSYVKISWQPSCSASSYDVQYGYTDSTTSSTISAVAGTTTTIPGNSTWGGFSRVNVPIFVRIAPHGTTNWGNKTVISTNDCTVPNGVISQTIGVNNNTAQGIDAE